MIILWVWDCTQLSLFDHNPPPPSPHHAPPTSSQTPNLPGDIVWRVTSEVCVGLWWGDGPWNSCDSTASLSLQPLIQRSTILHYYHQLFQKRTFLTFSSNYFVALFFTMTLQTKPLYSLMPLDHSISIQCSSLANQKLAMLPYCNCPPFLTLSPHYSSPLQKSAPPITSLTFPHYNYSPPKCHYFLPICIWATIALFHFTLCHHSPNESRCKTASRHAHCTCIHMSQRSLIGNTLSYVLS